MTQQDQRELAAKLISGIRDCAKKTNRKLRFMEVCGTHTVAIFRAGLRQILPENVELVSGPGCPVCVTPDTYMDQAIAYSRRSDTIIATFGDMLKVPGTESSLAEERAHGADLRIVYSPADCLEIAQQNPDKKIIFLAVGFETTAPTAAATVLSAKRQGIYNLFFLSAQKLVPPVMRALLAAPDMHVDGFLLPGHVCVVTGTNAFQFLARDYHMPGVVAGFEAVQILRALYRLAVQVSEKAACIENEYGSVVQAEGNLTAIHILREVYEEADAEWRGMGKIAASGLRMREEYADYDIDRVLPIKISVSRKKTACRCGEVLRGAIYPKECPLFAKSCTPEHAIGPCMVSVEGVCAAWYKYGQERFSYGR